MPAGTLITTRPEAQDAAAGLRAPDPSLLARPLEYLLVDHLRQRSLCALLELIADADRLDSRLAGAVADHIAHDLAVHTLDDEEDLYPLVRRRAEPEDRVEAVLGLLSGEHADEDRLAATVVEGLRQAIAVAPASPSEALRARLHLMAERLRRHLTVENALIMPLAETRLTQTDRAGLARRMAARRGFALTGGRHV